MNMQQLRVSTKTFFGDMLSGLVMAVISVPGALANGVLAGVNPVYGLYSLIAGTTAAALFTSSVIMNVDSTSAIALATSDALHGLGPEQHLPYLVVLSLMVGAFQLAFGLLRLGFLTRLISNSVMTGFLTGIALLTILGQVGDITDFYSEQSNRVLRVIDTVRHADQVDLPTLMVGLITIVAIWATGRIRSLGRYSYPIGLVLATIIVPILALESVKLVGDTTIVPRSLPEIHWPDLSLVAGMVIPALSVAIIGLAQAAGVSQSVPNPDGQYPDNSGDFRGQGVGNIAAGFVGGLPVGGSLSGTTLIQSCGGKSRWANIFTGVFGLLVVLFAARVIEILPSAALGGLLVMVGIEMFRPQRILVAWQTAWTPRVMMVATFLATMILQLQYAILFGVGLQVVWYIIRSADLVRIERIKQSEDGSFYAAPVPDPLPSNEVVVLHPVGGLFFAGAVEFEEKLPELGSARHTVVILRLRDRDELGSTFLRIMRKYAHALQRNGCKIMLAGVDKDVLAQLKRTGVIATFGAEDIFLEEVGFGASLEDAIDAAQDWIDSRPGGAT